MPTAQQVLAQLNNMSQENPTFTFSLDLNEANAILAALQELPAKVCNPLTEKIKSQAQMQINALQAADTEAEKAPETAE